MSLVLDSSVTLAWCFDDERTDATDALLEQVVEAGAEAPSLWPLEILNALWTAERRGRIDADRRLRLAIYDAAYVELAQRLKLPLATLDVELRAAAGMLGIELLRR